VFATASTTDVLGDRPHRPRYAGSDEGVDSCRRPLGVDGDHDSVDANDVLRLAHERAHESTILGQLVDRTAWVTITQRAGIGELDDGLADRVESWLRGDVDAVMACVTDDVVFSPCGAARWRPTVGAKPSARSLPQTWATTRTSTLGDLVVAGDAVVGPWWYPPGPDGTTFRGLDLYTLRDGKIAAKDVFSKRTASEV